MKVTRKTTVDTMQNVCLRYGVEILGVSRFNEILRFVILPFSNRSLIIDDDYYNTIAKFISQIA